MSTSKAFARFAAAALATVMLAGAAHAQTSPAGSFCVKPQLKPIDASAPAAEKGRQKLCQGSLLREKFGCAPCDEIEERSEPGPNDCKGSLSCLSRWDGSEGGDRGGRDTGGFN